MSLAVLLSISNHKVQCARFAVSDFAQQSNRILDALQKLERYRLDYSALHGSGRVESAALYADQQLFLQRMDDNIMALRDQYTEVNQLLESAQDTLKTVSEKNEVLTSAISRRLDRIDAAREQQIQAECDESGRIISRHFRQHKSSH